MSTFAVTIGRNVDGVPLSEEDWQAFAAETDQAVAWAAETIHVRAAQHAGQWNDAPELACTWIAETIDDAGAHEDISALRLALRVLAGRYGQEAIALTVGETELVVPFASGTYGNPSRGEA